MVTLNHIGIAVSQAPHQLAELQKLFSLLGLKVDHSESVPEQGVTTHFIQIPARSGELASLELLEITDPLGLVAKFVDKRGPGIHHLSFLLGIGELDPLTEKLRGAGVRLIYDAAQGGAHHMKVNFIHPASAGGILIELMEPRA